MIRRIYEEIDKIVIKKHFTPKTCENCNDTMMCGKENNTACNNWKPDFLKWQEKVEEEIKNRTK